MTVHPCPPVRVCLAGAQDAISVVPLSPAGPAVPVTAALYDRATLELTGDLQPNTMYQITVSVAAGITDSFDLPLHVRGRVGSLTVRLLSSCLVGLSLPRCLFGPLSCACRHDAPRIPTTDTTSPVLWDLRYFAGLDWSVPHWVAAAPVLDLPRRHVLPAA